MHSIFQFRYYEYFCWVLSNLLVMACPEGSVLDSTIGMKTSPLNEAADGNGMNPFPIGQCLSPLPGESPTAHTKLKRKAPETPEGREKKREADRAYRRRCKEEKMKTEQNLSVLTEENKRLKRENDYLKGELEVKQQKMVQSGKDEMITLLPNELDQLKAQRQSQNVVVEVLLQQVASIENIKDLQCENKRLKLEMDLLIKKNNSNGDYLNLIQLQARNIKLEQEKNDLHLIIDALCAKINKDNDLEPKQAF
ncbi:rho-associated protein [Salix suchowensis]|nr:rho-associated protein [Salix suchowensis]